MKRTEKELIALKAFPISQKDFFKRDSLFGTLSEMIKSELEEAMFAIVGLGRTSRIVEMGRF